MIINITEGQVILVAAINGIFMGICSSIGAYLTNNHIIKKTKKLLKRIFK